MNKKLFLIALLVIPVISMAQSLKWKPWVASEAGLVTGSYGPTGDLRLQGGINKKGWLLGLGGAYDPYRYRSVPVYAQARKLFGNWKNKPFMIGSLGVNLNVENYHTANIAYMSMLPSIAPNFGNYQYSSGLYTELGAGWAFIFKRGWGFNLSLSYTQKTLKESYNTLVWNGSVTPVKGNNENKYLMNRLAFRIGIKFR